MAKRKIVFGYAETEPAPANSYLMEAFKFTAYDLHFNQEGDLSDTQFERLSNLRRFTVGLLTAIACFPLLVWFGLNSQAQLLEQVLVFGGVTVLICLPLLCVAWSYGARYYKDMYTAPIESTTEKVHLDVYTSSRRGASLTMRIGKETFSLNKKQFLALKNRDIYTVYYTPNTKRLLSIDHEESTL